MAGVHWLFASMWNRVINVSDEEIRNSPSVPVELIAAPASENQVFVPLAAFYDVDMVGGPYTRISPTASWTIEVGSLKTNPVLLSGILDSGESYGWAWTLLRQDILGTVPPFLFGRGTAGATRSIMGAGQALMLNATNPSGNFGGGDQRNSMNVTLSYILLNLN